MNSPAPLKSLEELREPVMPRHGGSLAVEETWRRLQDRMGREGATWVYVDSVRAAYVAGVYAASQDVLMRGAGSRDLSEAADRIEKRR